MEKKYKIRYLPLFYEDVASIASYISETLNNPKAALNLVDDVECAILERLESPEVFEKYKSEEDRECPYYRIRVRNYLVFYVVLEEGKQKVMEVRRFLYGRRYLDGLLFAEEFPK